MFCPKCGDKNPDDARFCGSCGETLPGRTRDPIVRPDDPPAQRPQEPLRDEVPPGLKIGVAAGTVIIPLIGIVMGIIYMLSDSPSKKSAARLWLGVAGVMFLIYCIYTAYLGV
jgi:uncharacterized membrane protein YvbJ